MRAHSDDGDRALARELSAAGGGRRSSSAVIAVGIFLTPGRMAADARVAALVFAVWAFMGRQALCGALCFGELAARYPEAGGAYVYLREAYGPARGVPLRLEVPAGDGPGLTAALASGSPAT